MSKATTFYLVRHGQSEQNYRALLGEVYKDSGALGSSLTDTGRRQAHKLAQELKPLHFDRLFSSHLQRAVQTAEILGEGRGRPLHIIEDIQERLKTETLVEAAHRLLPVLRTIALENPAKTILVVSHGAILRGLLVLLAMAALEEIPAGSLKNTGYLIMESDAHTFTLLKTQGLLRKSIN